MRLIHNWIHIGSRHHPSSSRMLILPRGILRQCQRLYFLDIAQYKSSCNDLAAWHNKFIFWDEGKSCKFPCSGLTGLTNGILRTLCCPLQWVTMNPVHHNCNGDKTPRSDRVTLHPLVANCMGVGGIECPSFIILLPELVLSKVWEQGIMMVNCSQVFTGEGLADNFLAPLDVIECYNYN